MYPRVPFSAARYSTGIKISLLLFFILAGLTRSANGIITAEQRLFRDLFANYSADARPILDSSKPVLVSIGLQLARIKELNEKEQVLRLDANVLTGWLDQHLTWDPLTYGIKMLVVQPLKIWYPDIALINGADQYFEESYARDFKAKVYYDGTVFWSFGGIFSLGCTLDMTKFPFDTQVCRALFQSWAYNGESVNLTSFSDQIDISLYEKHGIWELTELYAHRFDNVDETLTLMPGVSFNFSLKRKSAYYIFNIILPCLLMTGLVLLMFWLPVESGEKTGLGVTLLLAFTVFQLMIAESTPKTSETQPLLSFCLIVILGVTSLSIVLNVVVIHIYSHGSHGRVPQVVKRIFFQSLACVLCIKSSIPEPEDPDRHRHHRMDPPEGPVLMKTKKLDSSGVERSREWTNVSSVNSKSRNVDKIWEREILRHLQNKTNDKREAVEMEAIAEEWKTLAKVLDRLFFWLTTFSFIIGIIMVFLVTLT